MIAINEFNCDSDSVQIKLKSLELYPEKKEAIGHDDPSINIILSIINQKNDTVSFQVDHNDYSHFNFKGFINYNGINDTLLLNSFRNPDSILIPPKNEAEIILGVYHYRFDKLPNYNSSDILSLIPSLETLALKYVTSKGRVICVSKPAEIPILIKGE